MDTDQFSKFDYYVDMGSSVSDPQNARISENIKRAFDIVML